MSTNLDDLYRLSEADRRQGAAVRLGRVAHVDHPAARCRVRLADDGLTDWLPWGNLAAGDLSIWRPPSVGEQVMVLAPSGELNQARVLPGLYRDCYPAPSADPEETRLQWSDGAYLTHHRGSGELRLFAPGGVWIDVEGQAQAQGEVRSAVDVSAHGGGVSLGSHSHCGVEPGGGCTGPPTGGS